MRTARFDALVGANLHAPHDVCRVVVAWTAQSPRHVPRAQAAAALATLAEVIPGAVGAGDDGPTVDLAAVLLDVIAGLLAALGLPPRLRALSAEAPGVPDALVFDCVDTGFAQAAADLALRLVDHLLPGDTASAAPPGWRPLAAVEAFLGVPAARVPRADALHLMQAAAARDIPAAWLGAQLVAYGQGRRQRRMLRNATDRTPWLAWQIASDKAATNTALARAGLPVPAQAVAADADGAQRAARALGWPVVVKPAGTDMGIGVAVGVADAAALAAAYAEARRHHPVVIVERYVAGDDYRLLVVDGRCVAAIRRVPAHVVADGRATIAELVAATNRDPRRGRHTGAPLRPLVLDAESLATLAAQGYTPGDTPPAGTHVRLRRIANAARGGTSIDVTDAVHPGNRRLAETAAAIIGLDIAGVDLLTPDIGRPWQAAGGAICEVNPAPGVWPHIAVAQGRPRDVATPLLDLLFPHGGNARIPVAAITGTNGKTTTARLLARLLRAGGDRVGLACSEGTWVDDQCLAPGDRAGGVAVRDLLLDPRIDAAVLEIARGAILKLGCGVDACDVAAVLNVDDDHLGDAGIVTRAQMAAAKGLLVTMARRAVVLNAEDPLCMSLAARRGDARLLLFALDPAAPAFAAHVAAGGEGCAVVATAAGPAVALYRGGAIDALLPLAAIPATWEGRARHNVANVLAAVALAHALEVPRTRIVETLAAFRSDAGDNPGRINPIPGLPFTLFLDRCHNRHGMAQLGVFVRALPVAGRRVLGLSAAGDRRDVDLETLAAEAARHFDAFVIYPPPAKYLRERTAAAITDRLVAGLRAGGAAAAAIHVAADPPAAMDDLLAMAAPGDLVVATFADRDAFMTRVEACRARLAGSGGAG